MTPRVAFRRGLLVVASLVALTGCGGRQFLGAPLPASCTRSRAECSSELRQRAWRDTVGVHDPALLAYVRGVVARLVRVSMLREPPDVSLGWFEYGSVVGRQIHMGVDAIVRFDSEAELAGILAHEIAHLEARYHAAWDVPTGTDDESVADERAVTLLSRAGYPPGAFATGLARLFGADDRHDRDHPPTTERIQRARLLAEQLPAGGDDRRAALLAAIDGRAIAAMSMVFSDGSAITGRYLTIHDAGPADADGYPAFPDRMFVVLPDSDIALGAPRVGEPSPTGTWNVWPVGRAGAAAIAATLANPHRHVLAGGTAIVGGSPPRAGSSLDRVIQGATDEIAAIGSDPAVAVIATPAGGVVITLDGSGGTAMLERWLGRSHRPTAAERAHAVRYRIRLATATRTAPLRALVASCPDPALAAEVESGDRTLHAGERFKCAMR